MTAVDVLAVVEVGSPGTRRTDRIAEGADDADAGVAHYLLVEPGPPVVLSELVLGDDRDGAPVRWTEPAVAALALGAAVDLATLADLRGQPRSRLARAAAWTYAARPGSRSSYRRRKRSSET